MDVKIIRINSVIDAMRGMYMSKRTYGREIENRLESWECDSIRLNGGIMSEPAEGFKKAWETLLRIGQQHTTLLRFIDLTVVIIINAAIGLVDDADRKETIQLTYSQY